MSRYQIVNGVQVAPGDECIVCGLRRPDGSRSHHWGIYLAGSVPLGAIACSPSCASVAVDRMLTTGRADEPESGETSERK